MKNKLKKIFSFTKEERENNRFAYTLMKRFFYTYTAIAIVTILVSFVFHVDIAKDGDFLNWTTFVFELGLGAYVALAILAYENFQRKKLQKSNREKRDYVLQKLGLLITLAKEQSEVNDFDELEKTFDKVVVTLTVFSDALNAQELQQILELSEIGKWACSNKGSFSIISSQTLPFTTSVPASMGAFFAKFDSVLELLGEIEKTNKGIELNSKEIKKN